MNWTLLVPGALLPPRLAPELARAMRTPVLVEQLAQARPLPAAARADGDPQPGTDATAVHWRWLAGAYGVVEDAALATAPYCWRAAAADRSAGPAGDERWIAHCEPVHMAIARDHFVVTDLGDTPLAAGETEELLARANAVLQSETGDALAPLHLRVRDGRWYLTSAEALQLRTWSLDAVLGRSVQDRLPEDTGSRTDARRWRVLANEIQMSWHASDSSARREAGGARSANALWLHGGGSWRRLDAVAPRTLRIDPASVEAAVLHGWSRAGTAADASAAGSDVLALCRAAFVPYVHQAWESWLDTMRSVDACLEAELQAACAAGARRFELVLCGAARARTVTLPLAAPWWRRLPGRGRAPAQLLERWLAEPPAHPGQPGALAA